MNNTIIFLTLFFLAGCAGTTTIQKKEGPRPTAKTETDSALAAAENVAEERMIRERIIQDINSTLEIVGRVRDVNRAIVATASGIRPEFEFRRQVGVRALLVWQTCQAKAKIFLNEAEKAEEVKFLGIVEDDWLGKIDQTAGTAQARAALQLALDALHRINIAKEEAEKREAEIAAELTAH